MLPPSITSALSADYASLVSLFARRLGDVALAQDLVGDAFVHSLEKLYRNEIADPGRFSGFVYGVAFNLLRNHKRRICNRVNARAGESDFECLSSDASPYDELCDATIAQLIRDLVTELPSRRDRELVTRYCLREEEKSDLCRALSLAPQHFDKVLFRTRRRLQRLIRNKGLGMDDLVR